MRWSTALFACLASTPLACLAVEDAEISRSAEYTPDFCVPGLAQLLPKSALITEVDFNAAELLPIDYDDPDFTKFLKELTDDESTPTAKEVIRALKERNGKNTRKDVECAVCFGCLDAVSLATYDCGHYFHDHCLALMIGDQCPICRQPAVASNGLGTETDVKKMLRFFENQRYIPPPSTKYTDATAVEIAGAAQVNDYVKDRARYHVRGFNAAMYEMTSRLRKIAGQNVKNVIGVLLNVGLRRAGSDFLAETVDQARLGPFGNVRERSTIIKVFHHLIHDISTRAGVNITTSQLLPPLPDPENLVDLFSALVELDRVNTAFGTILAPLFRHSTTLSTDKVLSLINRIDALYPQLAHQMGFRNAPISGPKTRDFVTYGKLLANMDWHWRREGVFDFTIRYVTDDFDGEATAIREIEHRMD